jgi:hypothetical protein
MKYTTERCIYANSLVRFALIYIEELSMKKIPRSAKEYIKNVVKNLN